MELKKNALRSQSETFLHHSMDVSAQSDLLKVQTSELLPTWRYIAV